MKFNKLFLKKTSNQDDLMKKNIREIQNHLSTIQSQMKEY